MAADVRDPVCSKCGVALEYSDGLNATGTGFDNSGNIADYLFCPNCNDFAYDPDNPETKLGELS